MINVLFAILFALGLITSGGVTVAASQTATPEDVLYPVRTWSEDVRLAVADPATEAALAYKFAEQNIQQMKITLQNGGEVKEAQLIRTEKMLANALRAAAGQEDLAAKATLASFRTSLQKQLTGLDMPAVTEPQGVKAHDRLQTLLKTAVEITAIGEVDPVLIRKHDRDRVNDNANGAGLQLRSEFQWSMPVDGVVAPIQSNPWITDIISATAPYSYSFSYATPNLSDTSRAPAQAGAGLQYQAGGTSGSGGGKP